ncbi:MAG: chaperone modulatory protein CbpM [Cellvibrionaceae bacterium]
MTDSLLIHFNCNELCEQAEVSIDTLIEFVEHGIVEPHGSSPDDWVFEQEVIVVVRRAVRMHFDLGVDWAGVALALDLIEQRERLRTENESLRNRLNRFLSE